MSAADTGLAVYAARDTTSRGRVYDEPSHGYRGEYQRDRDRILHSTAFRRLVYKTQVFVNHEGDMYRTRLTHSLEVAQIARTIARALNLNEALVEAICLAHDLGHTPFGHAGQDALHDCTREYGGFEHNLQSLRVVDRLEQRYADFPGLNLTFETREGILKHCSAANARKLGALGERFIERSQPGLEAQIANLADAIAYNHHDVDDGLRAGLLDLDELVEVTLFGGLFAEVGARYPAAPLKRRVSETVRRMIDTVVTDLLQTTRDNLDGLQASDIDDIRAAGQPLVSFSPEIGRHHAELKKFLHGKLYRHHRVLRMTRKARRVVTELFEVYMEDARLMPPEHAEKSRRYSEESGRDGAVRAITDYIAGMTDRFAISEHRRLFDPLESP